MASRPRPRPDIPARLQYLGSSSEQSVSSLHTEKTFDSVDRNTSYKILRHHGIPDKYWPDKLAGSTRWTRRKWLGHKLRSNDCQTAT